MDLGPLVANERSLVQHRPSRLQVAGARVTHLLERSERVELDDWENRALVRRLGEALVRPAHRWF